jgi:hypothetical protein
MGHVTLYTRQSNNGSALKSLPMKFKVRKRLKTPLTISFKNLKGEQIMAEGGYRASSDNNFCEDRVVVCMGMYG